ncbi:uncharacterized protein LOC117171105 [Belonocnema kinseyi]|uniref:uncharacterized protein LOC117171105 n=1 Tax=Belonocnema kinseyi TaxID=2817044 RepID=UPI00143DCD96|nr:uncharacterized protein LOC117171105 [Belonocnema kinseyi]
MNTKHKFWEQIKKASQKAANVTTALSRLMANYRGPKSSKRRLLMSVTTSILLYGAEIWADAIKMKKYRKRMAEVQKLGALKVACSYRTVSEPAIFIIAGVIPFVLQPRERKYIYQKKAEIGKLEAKGQGRAYIMEQWSAGWREDSRDR